MATPRRIVLGLILGLILGLAAGAAPASTDRGQPARVTQVSDGDTVWVQLGGRAKAERVRLRGIDAPESCQPHGPAARDALRAQVLGRTVLLQGKGRDDYGRLVRRIATDTQPDVNAWMVAQGHAWSYRSGRGPGPYAAQQAQAQAAGRGLWSRPGAIEPRAFRKLHGPCR